MTRPYRPLLTATAALVLSLAPLAVGQDEEWTLEVEEAKPQTLEILPDPPAMRAAATARLLFRVAPLSSNGLLSKQVYNQLKVLSRRDRKARIVHLRAFVAGSGDIRRVQSVVSEFFAEKNLPLPALSVVQVGPLPAEGAQVVIESISEARRPVNPHGLAFLSGQSVATGEAVIEVAPLVKQSIGRIQAAARDLDLDPAADVVRVTCYCSSIQDGAGVRAELAAAFPNAAWNYVQLRRAYTRAAVNCEAVARLNAPVDEPLRFLNPEPQTPAGDFSQVALVGAERLVLSGTQLGFEYQESDVRLALERMGKSLDENDASYSGVAMARYYTLSAAITASIRKLVWEFLDRAKPPAATIVELEGLPSLDASFAVDVIAVGNR